MSLAHSDWVYGITLSVLASIFGGASKLAIRKSFLIENALDISAELAVDSWKYESEIRANRRTAFWLRMSGMFGMTFLNPLCGVLAMNFASPSIVAPFSGLTLVWIVLFSDILIGEAPSCTQLVAASLIVIGEVVVAIYGDHTNDEEVTLVDVERSYREPAFIAYLVGVSVWMVVLCYWITWSNSRSLTRFALGVAGGSLTGMQNFLKDGLTILKANEGLPWYSPMFLLLAVLTAFGGLLLLTACMKRHDVTYSSAMFVGAFVISASVMSAAHYHTFENLENAVNYILYPVGLIILMIGVCILAHETNDAADDNKEFIHNANKIGVHDLDISFCSRLCTFLGFTFLIREMQSYGGTTEGAYILRASPTVSYECV
jgi:uncharacterized membrane protein